MGLPAPPSPRFCPPPSSEHKPRRVFPQEKSTRLISSPSPAAVTQPPDSQPGRGCRLLVHSCVHIEGQGKTTESNAKLGDHRELWARPDTVQKTYRVQVWRHAGQGGAGPTRAHSICHISGPFQGTSCTPPQLPPAAPPTPRGRAAAGSGQRPHQLPRRPIPSLLPKKALL